ncbi:serine/threonine-protein kinase [Actinocrinis sp.]|uniref:serine/threonine-protein kinase n=1 Tax=Actinocrinis sp. TaxID=1920516 RepID=UPI002D302AC3|nr:serine/threonine-protein kinase [Actinocrinis sp.]HZP52362.1 serine/threonine-protein kinase [Actinocrinis sp.]
MRDQDPVQIGHYRLRARLGGGGMGEVFLSFDETGRPVAVKVLRREFADDRTFRSRFGHEVRAARQVSGPGIAPLLDADPDAEAPWLATEYIAGPTLADAVELYGPLPVSAVIVLMSGIAASLQAIHETGIVHRDLKPANVVLGADGLRVIDFGIARAADATPLTLTGMMIGSPQYVAPEQVLGEPPAPAGDVFSLGALAHYAATGRPAFGEGPKFGVVYRIVNERPDLAGCPRQIRSLIESCLAKDPAERPTTAEILETCTPDEPPGSAADWLPEPVVFAIGSYRAALAELTLGSARADDDPRARPSEMPRRAEEPEARRRPSRRALAGLAAALAVVGTATGVALVVSPSGSPSAASGSGSSASGASHGSALQAASGGQSTATPFNGGPPQLNGPGPGGQPPGGPGDGRPPPPVDAVVWTGTIKFTDIGMWLDPRPPAPATGEIHGDIREASPAPAAEVTSNSPHVQNLALWTGTGTPTGTQCRDFAFTHGTWQLQHVSVGEIICALTAYRQVAVLRITGFPTDDSGVTAAATVWGSGGQ